MNLKQLTFSLITFSIALIFGPKAAEAATLTTIVDGISNARGASFGPDGTLYVGEPGIGGNGNCQPSPSTLFQPLCEGNTGSVVKITPDGRQERIFQNFQSLAEQPSGNQGAGPQELNFDSSGNAYLLTGFAGYPGNRDLETNLLGQNYEIPPEQLATFPPSSPDEVLNTPNLAKLLQVDLETEELTEIFDFGEYEIINNPDGADVVTNPYDFVVSDNTAYVVDGGGNYSVAFNKPSLSRNWL
ncbi:MAG: ScyD/ScyE family protein [Hydrococcus sp. Prado102]|nr:ScyD/ScyE family protein [Hydrococcus sp. Prado102]